MLWFLFGLGIVGIAGGILIGVNVDAVMTVASFITFSLVVFVAFPRGQRQSHGNRVAPIATGSL